MIKPQATKISKNLIPRYGIYFIFVLIIACDLLLAAISEGSWWSLVNLALAGTGLIIYTMLERPPTTNESIQPTKAERRETEFNQDQASPVLQKTGSRVLFISSDKMDKNSVQYWLNGWEFNHTHSGNCAQAISELMNAAREGRPYHIVVTDQTHMELRPLQFVSMFRSEPLLQSIYLINIAPPTSTDITESMIQSGYSRCLETPLDKRLLFSALKSPAVANINNAVSSLESRFSGRPSVPKLDILIAESQLPDQIRIKHILTQLGHQVYIVENGDDALEALDTHHFDLAILDFHLDSIDGVKTVKLHNLASTSEHQIPFIITLDENDINASRECIEAGITLLIHKPCEPWNVNGIIRKALERSSSTQQIKAALNPTDNKLSFTNQRLIDTKRLRELQSLSVDSDFIVRLLDKFSQEGLDTIKAMKKSLTENRFDDLQAQNHTLRDSAGNIGALELRRQTTSMSQLTASDPDAVTHLLHSIDSTLDTTIAALREHLSEQQASHHID